jgi:hypothetical protein
MKYRIRSCFSNTKVLTVLPEAAETTATFTPLAPFSKLIGKEVKQIVDAIAKKNRNKEKILIKTSYTAALVIQICSFRYA